MVRLGTCVHSNDISTLEGKFEKLVKNGFDNCQLICWNPDSMTEENGQYVKSLCEKYGVTVSALWVGWEGPAVWNFYEGQTTLGLVPTEYRWMRVQTLCKGSDYAKAMGVSDIITHMGFIPENPNDPNFMPFCDAVRHVAVYCKKNGQNLLFETGQETPVTLIRCFEVVGRVAYNNVFADNLGINLDTANCILYGRANPVDSLEVFGKYVRNLHAKDGLYPTNGHDLGQETKIGEGWVDFDKLIKRLHELGFDRFITIEREISGEQQTKDILHAKEYLQKIIDKYYTK